MTLMAVFELISLVRSSNYILMRHTHINNLKLFKITVSVVNNLFSGQLKQENTKYICFTAGP